MSKPRFDPRDPRLKKPRQTPERVKLRYSALVAVHKGPWKKTILNEQLMEEMAEYILDGLPIDKTCALLGIYDNDFQRWLQQGDAFIQNDNSPPHHAIYAEFGRVMRRALARYQYNLIRRSFTPDHTTVDWRRDLRILERRDRKNWGRAYMVTLSEDELPNPDERFL